jgi:hypothetical protein
MWTRKQYMDGGCNHRTYYAQFVTPGVLGSVRRWFTVERLVRARDQECFNTIPLIEWDRLSTAVPRTQLMRDAGEGWSLCAAVCILKEAGRQLVEAHHAAVEA